MQNMHNPRADHRGAVERKDPCNSSRKDSLASWQHLSVPPNPAHVVLICCVTRFSGTFNS